MKRFRTSAAAALNALCPETYSGKAGVTKVAAWYGCQVPPSIVCVPWYGPPHACTGLPA